MKGKHLTIGTLILFLLCIPVAYYGRIYYPEEFSTERVDIKENILVLMAGVSFILAMIGVISIMVGFLIDQWNKKI